MGKEIERKWLLDTVPEWLRQHRHKEYTQGYLWTDPVIRIRKEGDSYFLTYKGKGKLERDEYNLPINGKAFEGLLPKCEGIVIHKTRYFVPLPADGADRDPGSGTLTAEVDLFHDIYEGLAYAEVEFASVPEAESFTAPDWFGEEVTGKPGYSNSDLSRRFPKGFREGLKHN